MNQIRTAAIALEPTPAPLPLSAEPSMGDRLAAAVGRLASALMATTTYAPALHAAREAQALAERAEQRLADLERLSVTDQLTGLLNRRGFEAELQRVMSAARRYREKGVLVYVDLDGFKPINDSFGHAAGDAVLRHVAGLLAANIRGTDFAARLGGDEFAVLLTRTDWHQGLKRAEQFDGMVNGAHVQWQGRAIGVNASFGFQTYGPGDDLLESLENADAAMYATKRARADSGPRRARA